jgi:hypothetical protein
MPTSSLPLYSRQLDQYGHSRRLVISVVRPSGWDVREEHDRHVVRHVHYDDWHRVERARDVFSRQAAELVAAGWRDRES